MITIYAERTHHERLVELACSLFANDAIAFERYGHWRPTLTPSGNADGGFNAILRAVGMMLHEDAANDGIFTACADGESAEALRMAYDEWEENSLLTLPWIEDVDDSPLHDMERVTLRSSVTCMGSTARLRITRLGTGADMSVTVDVEGRGIGERVAIVVRMDRVFGLVPSHHHGRSALSAIAIRLMDRAHPR